MVSMDELLVDHLDGEASYLAQELLYWWFKERT